MEEVRRRTIADMQSPRVREEELPHRRAMAESGVGVVDIELPETDDLRELARAAVPGLVRKAVMLAGRSDSLPAVLGVIKELGDRGWGKAEQAVSVTVSAPEEARLALLTLVRNGLVKPEDAAVEAAALGITWEGVDE